jgi:hypothetical protein
MWTWRERWISRHICVYMGDTKSFGLGIELTTYRFDLVIAWFGLLIEWKR